MQTGKEPIQKLQVKSAELKSFARRRQTPEPLERRSLNRREIEATNPRAMLLAERIRIRQTLK
ncbi:MAG: hypothetical protein ACFFCW_41290 [Candidatus Hodarchaeota archaeon]